MAIIPVFVPVLICIQDVTKFKFEFDNVRTSNVLQQIKTSTNVLSAFCQM